MSASRDIDPAVIAAYRAAVADLPVLTRVVFDLHRVDDLAYAEISRRLSIDITAVEACVAEALFMISGALHGGGSWRWQAAKIEPAEQALQQRFRSYCEERLRALGIATPIAWQAGEDDDVTVMEAAMCAMPARLRNAARRRFGDRMTVADIAWRWRGVPWLMRIRLRRLAAIMNKGLATFEDWLFECASKPSAPDDTNPSR